MRYLADYNFKHIAAIGASNTRTAPHYGETVNIYGFTDNDYYIAILADRLNATFDNYGRSGDSSAEILEQAKALAAAKPIPDLVTVSSGSNDLNARGLVTSVNSAASITIENSFSVNANHRLEKYTVNSFAHKRGYPEEAIKITAIDRTEQQSSNRITMTFDSPHGLEAGDFIEVATSRNILETCRVLSDAGVQYILVKGRRVNNFLITDPAQQFRNETFDVNTGIFTPKSSAQYVRDLQNVGISAAKDEGLPVHHVSMVEHFKETITSGVETPGSGQFFTDRSLYNGHFNAAGQENVANAFSNVLMALAGCVVVNVQISNPNNLPVSVLINGVPTT